MSDSETRNDAESRTIDLSADVGEGCPNDAMLLQDLVTSASVSCGAHAGDPEEIRQTLGHARDRCVTVGAHPGYPDREHFGRREQSMSADAVTTMILDQVAFLVELASELGVSIRFLKPHGALYNQAQRQNEIARGVVDAAFELGLPLLGQPGTVLEGWAFGRGVRYVAEGFPDRRYRDDGSLVPRSEPNAILHDLAEMAEQVAHLIARGRVATLCIHGDDPRAIDNAWLVRQALDAMGIAVRSFAADGGSTG
jgi:UPF0271 protein